MSDATVQLPNSIELPSSGFIFGKTAAMSEVRRKIERAFLDDLPVLIEGESGTGKEVVGRYLHQHSMRREGPFTKLDCGATSMRLLEEEICGIREVAVSSGSKAESGCISQISRATLFLDQIGDLDLPLQRTLIKALDQGNSERQTVPVARRFICATRVDLESPTKNQSFLRDLLACFAQHRVVLLPLRERKEDIPQICDYLLEKFARDLGRPVPKLSLYALEAFQRWKWPGNIRELENWIARIVLFGTEEAIGRDFDRLLLDGGAARPRRHRALHMKTEPLRRRWRQRT